MNVAVHVLCYNEAEILPFTIRHYATFATRIVIHDLGSSDGSQELARKAGAEIVQHDCKGEFNDMLNKGIKNTCWHGSDADWVICADADELIYFPSGAQQTLESYRGQGIAIVKPYGYEMTSDVYPRGSGQIYDEVKHGGRDDYWYAKPSLFSPKQIESLDFGTGAHVVTAKLKNGRSMVVDSKTPVTMPACYLLHFHHIGGLDRITKRYAENQARQSAMNKLHKWGNMGDCRLHAEEKRRMILSRLERVIA